MDEFNINDFKNSLANASRMIREAQQQEEFIKNSKITNPIIKELQELQTKLENENLNSKKLLEIKNTELEQLEQQNKELLAENKRNKRNFWISFGISTLISIIALIVSIIK